MRQRSTPSPAPQTAQAKVQSDENYHTIAKDQSYENYHGVPNDK
jgi:hypothetical protein